MIALFGVESPAFTRDSRVSSTATSSAMKKKAALLGLFVYPSRSSTALTVARANRLEMADAGPDRLPLITICFSIKCIANTIFLP
jgi:hypothetical protein